MLVTAVYALAVILSIHSFWIRLMLMAVGLAVILASSMWLWDAYDRRRAQRDQGR